MFKFSNFLDHPFNLEELNQDPIFKSDPNESFQLYSGQIALFQGETTINGEGTISWSWFPHPAARFHLTTTSEPTFRDVKKLKWVLRTVT